MTGYHITTGYQSDGRDTWEELKAIAADICLHPELIADEAKQLEGGNYSQLVAVAERFRKCEDLTLTFHEKDTERDREAQIIMTASGCGPYRGVKEATRRAFCRLVMKAAHRKGIEICINVA